MHDASSSVLLAVLFNAQIVRWVVWVGLVVLTIALLILMRTRWGHSQPLGKCIVLSLVAHLLLGIYATTVNIVTATVGSPDGNGIQVALIDSSAQVGNEADSNGPEPWNAFAPDIAGADLDPASVSLPPAATAAELPATPEPERRAETAAPTLSQLDKPPEPPPADVVGPPKFATHDETHLARPIVKKPPPVELPSLKEINRDDAVPPPEQPEPADNAYATSGAANADSKSPHPGDSPAVESGADQVGDALPLVPVVAADPDKDGGERLGAPPAGSGSPKAMPEIYSRRMGDHTQVAKGQGATQASEERVMAALKWLAANQSATGRWDSRRLGGGAGTGSDGQNRFGAGSQADTGITGLSLLAFLAAGHTHLQGPHQITVRHGLEYLLSTQNSDGHLGTSPNLYEKMYCHAMATCALSEAYAMSGDERLAPALRRAIDFTVKAQHRPSGGWRYGPGESGDTSQLGWQLMALKSAELAGIAIPSETRDGIQRFLRSVATGRAGGLARYRPFPNQPASRSMTAEALVCRQFLRISDPPAALDEASSYLLQQMPGVGETNLYCWYYATLALYQAQGEPWRRWNDALQKTLLSSQRSDGELAGSWDPDPVWGGYGGRAYSTALSALCLEVYYRFLPLFVEAAGRERHVK
jgi:hypothetical protein